MLFRSICACYRTHGFKQIVLLGDSGGNQDGMKAIAEELSAKWADGGCRVHFISEYYDYTEVKKWLEEQGVVQKEEGLHDDFAITAIMMTVDPDSVRAKQRQAAGKFSINGIPLTPIEKTVAWGKRIVDFRADRTVKVIRQRLDAASK